MLRSGTFDKQKALNPGYLKAVKNQDPSNSPPSGYVFSLNVDQHHVILLGEVERR